MQTSDFFVDNLVLLSQGLAASSSQWLVKYMFLIDSWQHKSWAKRRFKLIERTSRVLLSRFWRLSKNQPQSSFFGACKIGSKKQPNMGGQLPNYILYWEVLRYSASMTIEMF